MKKTIVKRVNEQVRVTDTTLKNIINYTEKFIVENFGISIPITINNEMSYAGLNTFRVNDDNIVTKFLSIEINTRGKYYFDIIKILAHEMAHINFSDCHLNRNNRRGGEGHTQHLNLTNRLEDKLKMELLENGIVK
jgi:hypothetical protein